MRLQVNAEIVPREHVELAAALFPHGAAVQALERARTLREPVFLRHQAALFVVEREDVAGEARKS